MKKDKRIIRRPWACRRKGGWIIQPDDLLAALKDGEIAEIGNLRVGARQLAKLIVLMRFPDEEFLVSSNGQLDIATIKRIIITKGGKRRTAFRKPRLAHSFRVSDKAWIQKTNKPQTTVVIKPRKFS
ncbi:hypothetical protein LCGC14_0792180 [marine sediment metagenome]|uniref:Uncharacterized protein n=1 Tax=marine sediment metagenome TaxID=412755 RepID=A0A0F9SZ90_9ZZZZ